MRMEQLHGDTGSSREIELWRAVIRQAFSDADSQSGRRAGSRNLAQREARDWLLDNTADFREVCGLADLDPEVVRAAALKTRWAREILNAA